MTFQPCPGILEVALRFATPSGQDAANVFHVTSDSDGPAVVADLGLIATAFVAWFEDGDGAGSTYRSRISTDTVLDTINVRDLSIVSGTEFAASVGDAGEDSSAYLNNGLTVAMSARTLSAGRSFRGRQFWVSLCADSLVTGDANNVNPGFITDAVNAFNALPAAILGAGTTDPYALCVLSRFNKDAVPTPPHKRATGIGTHVDHYTVVDTHVDFQRRRAPGHNRHH